MWIMHDYLFLMDNGRRPLGLHMRMHCAPWFWWRGLVTDYQCDAWLPITEYI
jgi:hypothetical protein